MLAWQVSPCSCRRGRHPRLQSPGGPIHVDRCLCMGRRHYSAESQMENISSSLVGWQLLIGGLPITITAFLLMLESWNQSPPRLYFQLFLSWYIRLSCVGSLGLQSWIKFLSQSLRCLFWPFRRWVSEVRFWFSGYRLAGDCLASADLHCYRACPKPDKSAKTYSD